MNLFVFSSSRALNEFYQQCQVKSHKDSNHSLQESNNKSLKSSDTLDSTLDSTPYFYKYLTTDNIFLPNAININEFFNDIIIVPNRTKLPKQLRTIFLWKAIEHIEIRKLGFDKAFLSFLENSNFLFSFFDELESSKINIKDIDISDTYGDYEDHLRILEQIYQSYIKLLNNAKLYDVGADFSLNTTYLSKYEHIYIFIDGVLSRRDLEILELAKEYSDIQIEFIYTKYNSKVFDKILPFSLEFDNKYIFSINKNEIFYQEKIHFNSNSINVYTFNMRMNQALLVIAKINEWLKMGVENIAVILPDEEFARYLEIFDTKRNLNYAMGFKNSKLKQKLQNLPKELELKPNLSKIEQILCALKLDDELELLALKEYFEDLKYEEIIDFLLQNISNIDDNSGGKVKVIGILESRGIAFDKVVIVDFNDKFIPKLSNNDMFLNTYIRKSVNMPTLKDKESLQKHYYYMLINNAKEVAIALCKEDVESSLLNDFKYNLYDGDKLWRFFPKEVLKSYKDENFIAKNTKSFLSPSAIKEFIDCKVKFYYHYICGIKDNEIKEENYGSIIHRILRDIDDSFKITDIDLSEFDSIQRLNIEIILKQLEPFFKAQQNKTSKILSREQTIEFSLNGLNFKCIIDRIDKLNDKTIIIDYKLKKDFNIKKEGFLQLLIYKLALSSKYDNISCLYYDLYNNKQYIMEDNDEKEAAELLEKTLNELKGEICFSKCDDKNICRFCDYKYICNRF